MPILLPEVTYTARPGQRGVNISDASGVALANNPRDPRADTDIATAVVRLLPARTPMRCWPSRCCVGALPLRRPCSCSRLCYYRARQNQWPC